jgi:hypothetical protein
MAFVCISFGSVSLHAMPSPTVTRLLNALTLFNHPSSPIRVFIPHQRDMTEVEYILFLYQRLQDVAHVLRTMMWLVERRDSGQAMVPVYRQPTPLTLLELLATQSDTRNRVEEIN